MRRLTVALSTVVLVSWIALTTTMFFTESGVKPWVALAITVGYPLAAYLAILAVRGLVAWVIGGFRTQRGA
jgi:hypothetical protein